MKRLKQWWTTQRLKLAWSIFETELKKDADYAHSWHCNIAMPTMDATGCSHSDANKAATRVMRHLFKVDTGAR